MKKRIIWFIVIGLLAYIVLVQVNFNEKEPKITFKEFSTRTDWLTCPNGLANAVGDSLSTCVVGEDTIVDIAYAWLTRVPIGSIKVHMGPFHEGMGRIYYHGGVYNRISITNGYVERDETTSAFVSSDAIQLDSALNDKRVFQFSGSELSFSGDGSELFSSIRFGISRRGTLEVYRTAGITRMRLVL